MPLMVKRKEGWCWFIAKFSWEKGHDEEARTRLMPLFNETPAGIDRDTLQGFYLTGEREIILIGQTNDPTALQRFSTSVIYEAQIDAKFSYGIEIHELQGIYKKNPII